MACETKPKTELTTVDHDDCTESVSIVPLKRVATAFANKSSRHAPSARKHLFGFCNDPVNFSNFPVIHVDFLPFLFQGDNCPSKLPPSDVVQHHASFHQSSDLGMMIDRILHEDEKARALTRQVELARQIELERQRDLDRYD